MIPGVTRPAALVIIASALLWLPACSRAKNRADTRTTMTACNSLRSATILWAHDHPGGGCPLPEQLIHDKLIEDQFSIDDPLLPPEAMRPSTPPNPGSTLR
jgi:hypothetical protein